MDREVHAECWATDADRSGEVSRGHIRWEAPLKARTMEGLRMVAKESRDGI